LKLAGLSWQAELPSVTFDDPHFNALATFPNRKISWPVWGISFGSRSDVIGEACCGLGHAEASLKDIPTSSKLLRHYICESNRSFNWDSFSARNESS